MLMVRLLVRLEGRFASVQINEMLWEQSRNVHEDLKTCFGLPLNLQERFTELECAQERDLFV